MPFAPSRLSKKLFVDSGAYLTYTNGKEVNVDGYIAYANENMDAITIFAPVDKIPGVRGELKTKEQILKRLNCHGRTIYTCASVFPIPIN